MSEPSPQADPASDRLPGGPSEPEPESADDLGHRETDEERAYERAQPDSQPETSSEPEPDAEPADAG